METAVKAAQEAQGECERLRAELKSANEKLAGMEEVVLQKVAAASRFSPEAIERTLDVLVQQGLLPEEHREKYASSLASNSGFALDLVSRVASLHDSLAPSLGSGVDKTKAAGNAPRGDDAIQRVLGEDQDGWGELLYKAQ